MKLFNVLFNLAQRIKAALVEAKNYTDTNLAITEITPAYINTTAVSAITCYQLNKLTWVLVRLKTGVADQTTLARGLPTPIGSGLTTLSAFCMNGTDLNRDFTAFIQDGRLEVRCTSASQGAGGIIISGCYISS